MSEIRCECGGDPVDIDSFDVAGDTVAVLKCPECGHGGTVRDGRATGALRLVEEVTA